MSADLQPQVRTYLFVPGTRTERFGKALASGADKVVLDLEDAVAPGDKAAARGAVAAWIETATPEERSRVVVRINDATTVWFAADVAALGGAVGIGVLLPKAESAAQIAQTQAALPRAGILALIESARGVSEANRIAAAGAQRMVFGTLDFALDLDLDIAADGS
ncbi:MAG: CoA ester lyase, partial [Proteobacteria bacterium]|nr:CoA ester lyase [Pseudomonadota bacterium]